jgi:hypothetical protein
MAVNIVVKLYQKGTPAKQTSQNGIRKAGRGAAIRTRDLLNPIQVRYRAALRPADTIAIIANRPQLCKPPLDPANHPFG